MDHPNPSVDDLSSIRRRNKILIVSFFTLIILLALITGGFIISLIQKINFKSLNSNPAIREFCSPFEFRSSCTTLLSSEIRAPFNTDPNHIFVLSLEASVNKISEIISILSDGTQPERAFTNCSSLLSHAAGQLSEILEATRIDPDVETYERGNMTAWIRAAAEDLTACVGVLAMAESTAADAVREKVFEVRAVVLYSTYFLVNCETVSQNFRSVYRGERSPWDELVENLTAVSLFGLQYFVLVLLFSLLLRMY